MGRAGVGVQRAGGKVCDKVVVEVAALGAREDAVALAHFQRAAWYAISLFRLGGVVECLIC